MTLKEIIRLESASRDDLVVDRYDFGKEDGKKVAIVSGLRGDELMSLFVTSQLIAFLKQKEEKYPDFFNGLISIVPSVNHYAFNIDEKYFPLDKTSITRMFPGYDGGETTQRIAHKLFEAIKDYDYGIRISSGFRNVFQIPHIKLYETEFLKEETVNLAAEFGLKYIHIVPPVPFDTVTLAYNWELWGAKSFIMHGGACGALDGIEAERMINSILRFLSKSGIINYKLTDEYKSVYIKNEHIVNLKTSYAGIFFSYVKTGSIVKEGQNLGVIYDALNGSVLEYIIAPFSGVVFAYLHTSLIFENTTAVVLCAK